MPYSDESKGQLSFIYAISVIIEGLNVKCQRMGKRRFIYYLQNCFFNQTISSITKVCAYTGLIMKYLFNGHLSCTKAT